MNALIQRFGRKAVSQAGNGSRKPKAGSYAVEGPRRLLPEWPGLDGNRICRLEESARGQFGPKPASFRPDTAVMLYLRAIDEVKPVTAREELELIARTKQGDRKSRERLIKANLRRVTEISREYESIGLPLLDLISEGNLGLLKAVERFDPAGVRTFASYSSWWIKQSIKRALAAGPTPPWRRFPVHSKLNRKGNDSGQVATGRQVATPPRGARLRGIG